MATHGYLWMLNKALYPVKGSKLCILGLFIQGCWCINKHCLVNMKLRHANMAISLDGWFWAVSFLFVEKIQIRCLTDMHVAHITPLFQTVSSKSGCEGYSTNLYIPEKSELTSFVITSTWRYFSLPNTKIYLTIYVVWITASYSNKRGEIKIGKYPFWDSSMTLNQLNKRIKKIDTKHLCSVKPNVMLLILIAFILIWHSIIILIIYYIMQLKSHLWL